MAKTANASCKRQLWWKISPKNYSGRSKNRKCGSETINIEEKKVK